VSSKRTPAPPPQLPGFTFLDVLGSGGFADVYLFEQHLPRRKVAVKVLLPEKMAGGSAEQFAAEANVMALLSTHPAIVTIYQAGVSDDHRPYLAMEYCPKPNLQVRSRAAALPVAEALRIGIQVAAAVETAHRAGILHRDIKPANILVTEYNRPALTDFGIATSAGSADPSTGMSIPWSPPESFADIPEFGVRSDVWALGATLFTLLAGRSPFEVVGGRNGGAELIQRIEAQPLPQLDRADAPSSLQLALERAMAKRPGDRYDSAVSFARALQKVQIELSHSVTPIDILDDSPDAVDEEDEEGELTRVRGIVSIDPQTAPAAGRTHERPAPVTFPTSAATTEADQTVARSGWSAPPPSSSEPDVSATVVRPPMPVVPATAAASPTTSPFATTETVPGAAASAGATPADAPRRSRAGLWVGLGIGAAALVVVAVIAGVSMLTPTPDPTPSTPAVVKPQDPIEAVVPAPADLAGDVSGDEVVFTWTNPDPREGDRYVWYPYTLEGNGESGLTESEAVTLPADPSGTTCIAVLIRRDDGTTGRETRHCVP
jgi:serine/threonine protein kinase